jgi:DNA-binding cell septation regulator SpoVG
MLRINVENIGRGTKGHILASCRVTLSTEDGNETITIFDARVLRNRSGELWVGFPTQNVRDFEGMKFLPILDFSRDLRHRISDAVLAEYKRDDAEVDVRAEAMQTPAVRPAMKPFRQALIGSTCGRGVNNGR